MHRLMQWFSQHSMLTLLLIGLLSIAALFPASRIRIGSSIDNLMIQDDPERDYYQETRALFGSELSALIYIEDPELFSPQKLSMLQDLIADLEQVEHVQSSESLFSATDIYAEDGLFNVQPLIGWAPETDEQAAQVLQRAAMHPLLKKQLLSADCTATLVNLRLDLENGRINPLRELSRNIDTVLAPYTGRFSRLYQLGRPYIINQQSVHIQRDQRTLLPLATAVLLIMLAGILASFKGAVLPLLTSGISILWTFAFMGLLDLPLTILSFMVPSLIIVIGSTEDIHLLAEYKAGRGDGLRRGPAIQRMIARLAVAVLFTALTTAAGFLSITASPMPILHEFGLAASFGLIANPLVTISLIPACLALFPDRPARFSRPEKDSALLQRLLNFLQRCRRRPGTTLALAIIPCAAFGLYGAARVEPDNNIIRFFKPDSPVVLKSDRLHAKLSGPDSFCIRIDSDEPGAFKDPENLTYALRLQHYLKEQGWTDCSISLTDYLSYAHRSFSGSTNPLPASAQGVAEYLLLLHRADIEPYVTPSFQNLNIQVRHNVTSSRELLARIADLRAYIRTTSPANLQVGVTGEMLLVHKAVGAIVRGQLRGILIIAVSTAVLLSLLFRNLRIGCIALIPNLLPVGIQFGIMALAGIPLNTATSMAAAVGIGLAVDDTIHLLMRFYSQPPALDPETAVARSVKHTIKPVIATSMSLCLGFLVMRFSSFVPIGDFALLSAVVLITALLADLFVTPTLLSLRIMHPARRMTLQQPRETQTP